MAEIWLPSLHPAQAEISVHPARFKVLSCGRRFGKTALATEMMCDRLLDGQLVAYFAPTFRMCQEVRDAVIETLHPVIATRNKDDWRIILHTGGKLDFWSTSAGETVRGRKYHFAVVDEAALVSSADTWHFSIRPLLTDYKGGALFCSTPRGRNWFWQIYQLGISQEEGWQSWQFPTVSNPHIDPAEVEAARRAVPERVYQQEYLATFLDDGGAVFRGIDRVCTASEEDPRSGSRYVFGVDWGKSNDFTAISVVDVHRMQQVYLDRFNQISWQIQRDRLMTLYQLYKPVSIVAEANSIGDVNIEALVAEGLPVVKFMTTRQTKGRLIEAMTLAIEREEVRLLADEVLKGELQAYEMEQTSTGYWTYNAPPGVHDDTVIATALSLHGSNFHSLPAWDIFA